MVFHYSPADDFTTVVGPTKRVGLTPICERGRDDGTGRSRTKERSGSRTTLHGRDVAEVSLLFERRPDSGQHLGRQHLDGAQGRRLGQAAQADLGEEAGMA